MGFMDKFDEMKEKGKDAATEHGDKLEQGLDKGKDFANEKTGGKYSEQIATGVEKAKGLVGEEEPGEEPPSRISP